MLAIGPDLRCARVRIICQARSTHGVLEMEFLETEEEDEYKEVAEREVIFFPFICTPWYVPVPHATSVQKSAFLTDVLSMPPRYSTPSDEC